MHVFYPFRLTGLVNKMITIDFFFFWFYLKLSLIKFTFALENTIKWDLSALHVICLFVTIHQVFQIETLILKPIVE